MKLASFEVQTSIGSARRIGHVIDDSLLDLTASYAELLAKRGRTRSKDIARLQVPPNMIEFLRVEDSFSKAREAIDFVQQRDLQTGVDDSTLLYDSADVNLLAPMPRPNSLRDFMTFEEHVKNGFASYGEEIPEGWYEYPISYKGNPDAVVEPNETVDWPPFTDKLDFELELAAVIGKEGRNIPAEEASKYIAGFTVFNDFTARDIQANEQAVGFGPTKGKDFANGLGPYLVTPDEFDVSAAEMVGKVNGDEWVRGTSGDMYYSFEEMIEYISWGQTIYPGDIYGSGTIPYGCGKGLDRWIEPGDRIEFEVDGIGVLSHTIGDCTENVSRDYKTAFDFPGLED